MSAGRNHLARRTACGLAVVFASVLAIASPAFADGSAPLVAPNSSKGPDLQATNIPYVAWRGEQIRLAMCSTSLNADGNYQFLVESWTGDQNTRPQIEDPTLASTYKNRWGVSCVRGDVVSLGAGLARIKLIDANDHGSNLVKKQFLAIWMTLGDPAISEVSDPTGSLKGTASEIGDLLGDGNFNAGSKPGRIDVKVTGSFPDPSAPGGTWSLPSQWPALAAHYATDTNPANADTAAQDWDIHDTQSSTPPDGVDNFLGGYTPFSNVFGGSVTGLGPFDPLRADDTLLSDGHLTADDTPMPAARVDVSIAPNTGGPSDISGVGSLASVNKTVVDSLDHNGSTTPHNLYAPFYKQYIPATAAGPESSGIDGGTATDYNGFLVNGLYQNWAVASHLRTAISVNTHCNNQIGTLRKTPGGDQSIAVYTDEHGEAQAQYNPNAGGFYYDSLKPAVDQNQACDLKGIDVLGTSDISATARYPFQPVDDPAHHSTTTLHKVVHSLFSKELSYWAKGPSADDQLVRIVLAHANDVDGKPYAGEVVCFAPEFTGAVQSFTGFTGPGNLINVQGTQAPIPGNTTFVNCQYLDANGNAAIEIISSNGGTVDVPAEFIGERLFRDVMVNYSTASGGTPPPVPAAPGATVTPPPAVVAPPAPNEVDHYFWVTGQNPDPGKKEKGKAKNRLSTARVVHKGKKRQLVVRVNSADKSASITITLTGKNHRTSRSVHKTVSTNKLVTVMTLSSGVSKVRVTLG